MPTHHLLNGFSYWSLDGLHNPPVSGLPAISNAGYHTIEISAYHWTEEVVAAARASNLLLLYQCYPHTPQELSNNLSIAKAAGVQLVNVHASHPHQTVNEAEDLLNSMIDAAEAAGVRVLFETHRGRITQDLFTTAELCKRIPRLRLTLDASHYIVAEERCGPTKDLKPYFDPLLDHVDMIHGRISNGQQVQVDAGDGSGELPKLYKHFWSEAMRRWRMRSTPGSAFIFTPELGPPTYAITGLDGKEFSDRWQQSIMLRQLAEEAWKASAVATAPVW